MTEPKSYGVTFEVLTKGNRVMRIWGTVIYPSGDFSIKKAIWQDKKIEVAGEELKTLETMLKGLALEECERIRE